MKMKWKLFGMIFCLAVLLVMPQLALADVTESLIVNGEDILAATDNTVECGFGTAEYDPATKTLTLKNAAISEGNVAYDRLIEAKGIDLNIVLAGNNTLYSGAGSAGIYVLGGNLNISGQTGSKLDITVGDSNGISVRKSNTDESSSEQYNLSIDGVNVYVDSTGNAVYVEGQVEIKNGADVIANADEYVGIYGRDGVVIDNAYVKATSEKHNAINSPKNVEIKNGADVTATGYVTGISAVEDVVVTGANVKARATAKEAGNAIYSEGNIIIDGKSVIKAGSFYPALFGKASVSIADSEVNADSIGDSAIYSPKGISISHESNVQATSNVASGIFAREAVNISSGSEVYADGFLSAGVLCDGTVVVSGSKLYVGSASDIALFSVGNIEIKDGAEVSATGTSGGIFSNADVIISQSEVSAISTQKPNPDNSKGAGIYAEGKLDIVGSVVNAKSAFGYGVLCPQVDIKNKSDVLAYGTEIGMSCLENVQIKDSKVQVSGEKSIAITGDNPQKGDLYVYGSWLETSDALDKTLTAVNSALIENGEGAVVGNLTLPVNVNIAAGQTLTVPKSATLTVPKGVSLAVNEGGKLVIAEGGKVVKQQSATVTNNGTVEGVITEVSSGGSGGGGGGGSSIGNQDKDTDKDPDKTDDVVKGNNPFTDIKNEQWFYDDVMFVYEKGLMNGASDSKFDPSGTATRGMLATILWRNEKEPVVNYLMKFNDVASEAYYAEAIRWAVSEGVAKGYTETRFAPDEEITREQLAAVLYRYAKLKGADVSKSVDISSFADAGKVSDWAQNPLKWAVGNGIINGEGDNTLNPQGMAQRADIAAMLHRFLDKFSK